MSLTWAVGLSVTRLLHDLPLPRTPHHPSPSPWDSRPASKQTKIANWSIRNLNLNLCVSVCKELFNTSQLVSHIKSHRMVFLKCTLLLWHILQSTLYNWYYTSSSNSDLPGIQTWHLSTFSGWVWCQEQPVQEVWRGQHSWVNWIKFA